MLRSTLRRIPTLKPRSSINEQRKVILRVEDLEGRLVPATLMVGSQLHDYATIGAALVAAHPRDTIDVSAGIYQEAVVINTNAINLIATGAVTIRSPATVSPVILSNGDNIGAALIDIQGATSVTIKGFTLDGSTDTDGNLYAGIRVIGGGSASITSNSIKNFTTASNPDFGIGIEVGTFRGNGSPGVATVVDNTISNYLGVGVIVDGNGSAATIQGNTITDYGQPTADGVQISRNASAQVQLNTISGNGPLSSTAAAGAGVFVYEDQTHAFTATVAISQNSLNKNETGILVDESQATSSSSGSDIDINKNAITNSGDNGGVTIFGSTAFDTTLDLVDNVITGANLDMVGLYNVTDSKIENNTISGSSVGDGIYLTSSSGNEISGNFISNNLQNGIELVNSSNNNQLFLNTITTNMMNGILVNTDTDNQIILSFIYLNSQNGILLENTSTTTVVGDVLLSNGGYGLSLSGANNTQIALDYIEGNGAVAISNN